VQNRSSGARARRYALNTPARAAAGADAMKYTQTKAESVALLRQVLASIGPHDAALDPQAFAVFYEHAAGLNPRLDAALQEALAAQPRLDGERVRALYRQYVAELSADEAQRIQGDMQRVMSDIVQSAEHTGRVAGGFDAQLADLSDALAQDDQPLSQLALRLEATRAGMRQISDSVQTLRQKVSASQHEIERLRTDLLRAREEATLCPLTRVLNRRGFERELNAMLRSPPAPGRVHALILLDIDHFKRINDSHGHPQGDRVLESLGAVLRTLPAEPGMTCARYGGEEFAVLLPSSTLERALRVAEAARQEVRHIRLRNRDTQVVELTVTVSAGVAAWQPGQDGAALVASADRALYLAKAGGRNRVKLAQEAQAA
jgi:diguanylate cyclase